MPLDLIQERNYVKTMIEFPFRLNSNIDEIDLTEDVCVVRMDDEAKARLLQIENAKYDENGRLISFKQLTGCLFPKNIASSATILSEFCSSNYVLRTTSTEKASEFNLALKLFDNSCSSLYIGFTSNGSMHFQTPPCYFGQSALVVTQKNYTDLAKIMREAAAGRADEKLQTMVDIYTHAMSLGLRKESRFVEIAVVMEMLLLPSHSAELAYRFSLRLAKIMGKLLRQPPADGFEHGKSIYKTRSHLVHNGKDKKLEVIAPIAYNYARILLTAYLDDRTLFEEERLDALCLS